MRVYARPKAYFQPVVSRESGPINRLGLPRTVQRGPNWPAPDESPNLIPKVVEREKSKDHGEADGHWLLTMVPHANVDWVNRVRQSVSKEVTLTCRHNLTSDKPISRHIDLDRYVVSVAAKLGSADGNEAYPVDLGFRHRPKVSPPIDPAKLRMKRILMTPGEPNLFAFSFSRLEADEDGNVTDYRVKCWIVTLNHNSDDAG